VRSRLPGKTTCGYAKNLDSPLQRYCLGCGASLEAAAPDPTKTLA
jgi:hypothetical protein